MSNQIQTMLYNIQWMILSVVLFLGSGAFAVSFFPDKLFIGIGIMCLAPISILVVFAVGSKNILNAGDRK